MRRRLLAAAVLLAPLVSSASAADHWVAAWTAAPQASYLGDPKGDDPTLRLRDQTLRQFVRVTTAGTRVRLTFSNLYGSTPLPIARARAARSAGAADAIVPGSSRDVTFSGRASATVPPGASLTSDPVDLAVHPLEELAISLYFSTIAVASTVHGMSLRRSYVAAGDATAAPSLSTSTAVGSWRFLMGVDVAAPARARAVAALGDSLTDGAESTPGAYARWTDALARRLAAAKKDVAVLNEGISGTRLLHGSPTPFRPAEDDGLTRFRRDIANQPGLAAVVVLLGTNDIGRPGASAPAAEAVTADQLIAGYKTLIGQAHARGLRVYAGTLLPFEGSTFGFDSPAKEALRQAVNAWIRSSRAFDGVVDFDAAVRDPLHPARLRPAFDPGDHTHLDDAGYRAMAEAVDLQKW